MSVKVTAGQRGDSADFEAALDETTARDAHDGPAGVGRVAA